MSLTSLKISGYLYIRFFQYKLREQLYLKEIIYY